MPECPTCGREDFKNDRGMRQHHSRSHGESLSMVELTCEWCESSYEKRTAKAECSRFCSNECKFEWLHQESKERNTKTVFCANCGSELERHPHQLEKKQGHFCDHECHGEHLSGDNHHNWGGGTVTVNCAVCDSEIDRLPSRTEDVNRHFCSDNCHYQWISENLRGENHSSWKGGVSHEYPGGWREARKKALERDDHQCRACGVTAEEYKKQHGQTLDVHHVVPVREFTDPADAHSIGNLVTACRSCHAKYEGLPVFPF